MSATLPSTRHRTAAANLSALIEEARGCGGLGALDFDASVWPLPRERSRHGSMNTPRNLYFTRHLAGAKRIHHSKRAEVDRPLEQPFQDFLKAYVRVSDANSPRKMLADYGNMVRAGRYLHDVLEPQGYDPCFLTPHHFHRAFETFDADGPSSAGRYCIGSHLSRIAAFAQRRGVTVASVAFTNPVPVAALKKDRVGRDAVAAAEAKLPSEAALDALAVIATRVTTPQDTLLIRLVELLVCAPWRIEELLTLPVDCEVEQPSTQDGVPVLDDAGDPVTNYGIRYRGAKGFGWDVKWIPTAMVDVARRAIRDVRAITEPTRAVARWMAAHPGRAWMPEPWTGADPDMELGTTDISRLLVGRHDPILGNDFIRRSKLPHRRIGKAYAVRLGDIEAEFLNRSNADLPKAALAREDHLFLVPDRFFSETREAYRSGVRFVPYYAVQNFLSGRHDVKSAFERFGFTDGAGMPLSMTSHQLRHWLNTLAQKRGMSQVDIARWSGRRNVDQNAAYDHVSGVELAEMARSKLESGQMLGPVAVAYERLPPVDRADFLEAQVATAHVTDIGMCVNDWSLAPCHHHGACADCCDHLVVKGDVAHEKRTRQLLDETESLLGLARVEMEEGAYGSSNWVAHHERMSCGLRSILAVHEDARIAPGTLVQANPTGAARGPTEPLPT